MPRRPVFDAELGLFFESLRDELTWTQSDAARFAAQRGLKHVNRQVLIRLERGETKNPDPEVLRDLAELYDYPYEALVSELVSRRYGLGADLPRHDVDKPSNPQSRQEALDGGEAAVATRKRLQDLQDEVTFYKTLLQQARTHAIAIVAATDDSAHARGESEAGAADQPTRGTASRGVRRRSS